MKNRRPNRLKHYDYSENGYYFVTICTYNRECFFGEIVEEEMVKNETGELAEKLWLDIPEHFRCVELDEYVIMPNHIHGIVVISNVGNAYMRSLRNERNKMLLSNVIQQYKAAVTREINKLELIPDFKWQKSFYDHIIRNEVSLTKIRNYMQTNPVTWDNDKENLNFIPVTRRV